MKHLIAVFGMLFGIALSSCMAQTAGPGPGPGPGEQQVPDSGPNGGKLQAYKIAYLTQRMNLTPTEAERFWPVYYQYTAELRQAQFAFRNNRDELAREEAILNIRKKYNFEFSRALPREKVNMFFRAETDFNNFVRTEWMQRRQQRLQRRPIIR